jgi:hypothetical protein
MSRSIKFEVEPDGKVRAEAQGFVGVECEAALAAFDTLHQAVDRQVEDLPELWAQGSQQNTQTQGETW